MRATLLLLFSLSAMPDVCEPCEEATKTCTKHLKADRKEAGRLGRELEAEIAAQVAPPKDAGKKRSKNNRKKQVTLSSLDSQVRLLKDFSVAMADHAEKELPDPTEDDRKLMRLIDDIAELTDEHANQPSKYVADALALGLEAPTYFVRRHALGKLLDGQDQKTAVRHLTKSLSDACKDIRAAPTGGSNKRSKPGDLAEQSAANAAKTREAIEPLLAFAWGARVTRELARIPNADGYQTAAKYHAKVWRELPDWGSMASADLLRFGTQRSFQEALKMLPRAKDQAGALHDVLVKAAGAAGIGGTPTFEQDGSVPELALAWNTWLEGPGAELPTSTGKD